MDLSPAADAEPIQAVWLQRLGLADRAARTSLRLLDLHSGAPQVVWLGLRVRARARVRARVRVRVSYYLSLALALTLTLTLTPADRAPSGGARHAARARARPQPVARRLVTAVGANPNPLTLILTQP